MSLTLQITDAGRAAIVNATNTGTLPVAVTQVGITETAFSAAADGSDTALPGELKRLTTFAGQAVAADTIHVTIRDDSSDAYAMQGFALYLADGTVFALYGQASAVLEKSAQASMLLAADIIFADIAAASLAVGDTNFILPVATDTVQGIVELATDAEAIAGTDATRAVTPAAHKAATDDRFGAGAPSGFVKTLLTLASATLLRAALAIKGAALKDEGAGNGLDADLLDGQHGAYYLDYTNFTNTPSAPGAPSLAWADITGKPAYATRWAAWNEVTGKPTSYTPAAHSQDWSTITGAPAYATRWAAWSEVTGKPTLFPPSAHTQAISTIIGLQDALDAKAPLANPNFTGTVTCDGNFDTSDARAKHDLQPHAVRPLHRVVPFRAWRWNKDDAPGLGPIAQDVEAAEPIYVHEYQSPDGPRLAVNHARLALEIATWAAQQVDQLTARADIAESRVRGLIERNVALIARVQQLESR